ncbi:related to SGT2-cochaperone, glutamine-rich cytoplasmic protein [Sporisorium scitamineum]|uniref:RNA polymerase II-associated protein 3 n=1 Tax=Sporisorium scitamineum TaxID=49012 RepID=A0A0F7RS67_9BASI|nr:hypothetical protein [Sporisorium scitamineum]CDS82045.1 related to SGT2-cochaperone, glutamine-rich cytoplasmic protein [Sporisorium scitamineum]
MAGIEAAPDKEKALACKQKGNEAFAKKDWASAVGLYTAAHYADPTEPTYPLNRAMAYIKLGKFIDAERDCTTALSLSPNNVKALYRRATARVGTDRLELAIGDYESVLRLDPKNAEAKTGLSKARQGLEKTKAPRKEPVDLRAPRQNLDSAHHSSSSDVEPTTLRASTTSKDSSSSVEAARKFLQQVGMSDEDETASSTTKASTSALPPAKFPGETGSFLREVTTRKTEAKPSAPPDTQTASVKPALTSSMEQQAPTPKSTVSTAKKTASALNFGAPASQSRAVPTPTPAKLKSPASSGKLSWIEFHRKWKNKAERLQLLSSIDPEPIPAMIDAMLEPELVAEILQTLEARLSSQPDDAALFHLTTGILQALPRCKRFGMTVSMLDTHEKGYAASLIETIGKPDLKSVWEVK